VQHNVVQFEAERWFGQAAVRRAKDCELSLVGRRLDAESASPHSGHSTPHCGHVQGHTKLEDFAAGVIVLDALEAGVQGWS